MKPLSESTENKEFINDIIFIKEQIKTLEDTVYHYCPKRYCEILPLLHTAYDSMALICYRITK